ncbi:hypothetical protein FSARC_5472 [Fusarium sarcochroum]|uniref:AA1-like domain-containing protein n=1 Tax=Fusarium sarcochroum TaxID=1208366 RepID=A0A8H4TZT1_9HYPO|nr:hypothetical protein FSARC_5472 [Fusarium sarcochroum]
MRVHCLLSLALGLIATDTVVASRCKPHSSDTSSAASLTTSSTSASFTTESVSSEESVSTTESLTLDLSSTFATSLITTASSDSTTAETSSSEPTTTTSTGPFDPISTFNVVARGGPVPNAVLRSTGEQGNILTFNPTYSGTRVLSFSLDHSTSRLRESNGKYMCLIYKQSLSFLSVCGSETAKYKYLTCKTTADLTLSCTGPEGHVYYDDDGEEAVSETGGTVDHFYVGWEGYGYYSHIGGPGVTGGGYQALNFGLQQAD